MSPFTFAIMILYATFLLGFVAGYATCYFQYKRALDKFLGFVEAAQKQKRIDELYGRSDETN
jgi:hypothetical protein